MGMTNSNMPMVCDAACAEAAHGFEDVADLEGDSLEDRPHQAVAIVREGEAEERPPGVRVPARGA